MHEFVSFLAFRFILFFPFIAGKLLLFGPTIQLDCANALPPPRSRVRLEQSMTAARKTEKINTLALI